MEEINIYQILKDVPNGTEFYSPMFGNVSLAYLDEEGDRGAIVISADNRGDFGLDKFAKFAKDGELVLFPSKEMRDWEHFYKTGDIVENVDDKGNVRTCIFEEWEDKEYYTTFKARYHYFGNNQWQTELEHLVTLDWYKSNAPESYVEVLEKHYNGKLNRETLEIERVSFELGKLYVFNEEDEDGELTIIGMLIGKNESKDTLTFGNQYEVETEHFETRQAFDLRISVHKELRGATKEEQDTFNKAHHDWKRKLEDKRRKECEHEQETEKFKTFDKVLVRDKEDERWIPAIFIGMNEADDKAAFPYEVFLLTEGESTSETQCIEYEGNEILAFTSDPF